MAHGDDVRAGAPWPALGFGVGLRSEHYDVVLGGRPPVEWFEVVTENFMDTGGRPLAILEAVRRERPVALHGVALSIGSVDPLSTRYLDALGRLVARIEPALVTDHLCWTGIDGRSLYDLLPVPYTAEALAHVTERVEIVQERLGRRILLENPSTYIEYACSEMPEWDFLAALAGRSGCGILLDVNNVFVTCRNHATDPVTYLDAIPRAAVGQIHLGGFTERGTYLFDTHSRAVCDEVWALYAHAVGRFGAVSTLVEWDADVPPFEVLCAEAARARRVTMEALGGRDARHSA